LSEGVASLQWCGPDLQARLWTSSSSNVALAGRRDNRLRGFPQECTAPSGSGGDQAQGVISKRESPVRLPGAKDRTRSAESLLGWQPQDDLGRRQLQR
jgi:hypothetical protein